MDGEKKSREQQGQYNKKGERNTPSKPPKKGILHREKGGRELRERAACQRSICGGNGQWNEF